jgi:ABC-type metal ion transport system substrate-binding protein
MTWQGREVKVLSKQGLVQLKSTRSSKQDLADIEFLRGENNGG